MDLEELSKRCETTKLRVNLGDEEEYNAQLEKRKAAIDKIIEDGIPDFEDGLCPMLKVIRRIEFLKYIVEKTSEDRLYSAGDINMLCHYLLKYHDLEEEEKELYLLFLILLVKSKYGKQLCNWVHEETFDMPLYYCFSKELFLLIYKQLDDKTKEMISIKEFDEEATDKDVLEFLNAKYKEDGPEGGSVDSEETEGKLDEE